MKGNGFCGSLDTAGEVRVGRGRFLTRKDGVGYLLAAARPRAKEGSPWFLSRVQARSQSRPHHTNARCGNNRAPCTCAPSPSFPPSICSIAVASRFGSLIVVARLPCRAAPAARRVLYREESLLLIALLRILWRLSYQDTHDWLRAWPALALACGLPRTADGDLRIPSARQQCKRRKAAGAPPCEMLFILTVREAVRGRLSRARDRIVDSAPILAWRRTDPDAVYWGLRLIHWIHASLGAVAVIPWNPKRQKNRTCLPPTWATEELGKRGGIERFFGRVFCFFRLQRPPVVGWTAVVQRVALTYTAVMVVALAAHHAGRPDLIRSPKRVLAHLWEGDQ